MRRSLPLALLVSVLLVAGCSSTSGAANNAPPTGTNAAAQSGTSPSAAASSETTAASDGTVAFGHAFTWKDGLTVTISKPKAFTPSEFAAGQKGKKHVVVSVTVVNKTGKTYDPSLITMTMQSGDTEASEIFDSEKGIEGSPSTKLLNGRQAKYKAAFSVSNPADLVLEVAPGFEYDSALWTSQG